jgi:hypothetical protein
MYQLLAFPGFNSQLYYTAYKVVFRQAIFQFKLSL